MHHVQLQGVKQPHAALKNAMDNIVYIIIVNNYKISVREWRDVYIRR